MKIIKPLFIFGTLILPFTGNAQFGRDRETIDGDIVRNDPTRSGMVGVVLSPLNTDFSKLNFNLGIGAEVFYTYKSQFRLNGGYYFAYTDNITREGNRGEPVNSLESYGVPADRKKTTSLNFLASTTISSWEAEGNYNLKLGRIDHHTVAVTDVEAKVVRAVTSRIGYEVSSRQIQAKDNIQFKTTTPDYIYNYEGDAYQLTPEKLGTSATMVQSNVAVIGVAFTTFRDIRILLDDRDYSGYREEKSQTDIFFDVLYAHKIKLQDILYYHGLDYVTGENKTVRQRLDMTATPMNKLGGRIGFQVLGMRRWFGSKVLLEAGIRPGPKSISSNTNLYGQITIGMTFGGRIVTRANEE